MTKLVRGYTNQNNGDDWYNAAMNGINNGIGIAGALQDRDIYKKKMEAYDRETAEFERQAPERQAETEYNLADYKNKMTQTILDSADLDKKIRLASGTGVSNAARFAGENSDTMPIEELADKYRRLLHGSTGGAADFSFQPATLPEGGTAYKGIVKLRDGGVEEFNFASGKDLEKHTGKLRHANNLWTIDEAVDAEILNGAGKTYWNGLDEKARKRYGVSTYEEAKKNKDFMAHATDAFMNEVTGGRDADRLTRIDQRDAKFKDDQALSAGQLRNQNLQGKYYADRNERENEIADLETQAKRVKAINDIAGLRNTISQLGTSAYPEDFGPLVREVQDGTDELGQPKMVREEYMPPERAADLNFFVESLLLLDEQHPNKTLEEKRHLAKGFVDENRAALDAEQADSQVDELNRQREMENRRKKFEQDSHDEMVRGFGVNDIRSFN